MPMKRPALNLGIAEYLEIIRDWKLPASGEFASDGREYSYTYCYGSNGARDYMQEVAALALEQWDEIVLETRAEDFRI